MVTLTNLAPERLRGVINYDPATGVFRWLKTLSRRAVAGKEAGCLSAEGYVLISIDRTLYKAHRLAWLYMTNEWPPHDIDHRNGVRRDNRWENLRAATRAQNLRNSGRRSDNRSGFKGVGLHECGRWQARIRVGGKLRHLGLFDTPEAAASAYNSTATAVHGEFARKF